MGHGSVHIHHVVIGVVLVMVSGVTMVTLAVDGGVPEFTAAAIFFGIGAALVLDEFALILTCRMCTGQRMAVPRWTRYLPQWQWQTC